jgi:hypothetical protein
MPNRAGRWLRRRQAEAHSRSDCGIREPDMPAVRLDDRAGDCQAKAGSSARTERRRETAWWRFSAEARAPCAQSISTIAGSGEVEGSPNARLDDLAMRARVDETSGTRRVRELGRMAERLADRARGATPVVRIGSRLDQHSRELDIVGDPCGAIQGDLDPALMVEAGVRIGTRVQETAHHRADPRRASGFGAKEPREARIAGGAHERRSPLADVERERLDRTCRLLSVTPGIRTPVALGRFWRTDWRNARGASSRGTRRCEDRSFGGCWR